MNGNSISWDEIDLSDTKIVGAGLKSLCRCIKATYVDLNGIPITDKDMMDAADENQKVFEGCGSLGLARTKISDASVPFLDSECNALDLSHTEVTGTGFATWKNRKLTDLHLAHTQITDETLTNFPAMRLDYLDVSNTELTDKSIPHLIRMTRGENYPRIHITGTKITAESLINSNRELTIISSSFNERDEKSLKACERIEFTRTDPYK